MEEFWETYHALVKDLLDAQEHFDNMSAVAYSGVAWDNDALEKIETARQRLEDHVKLLEF